MRKLVVISLHLGFWLCYLILSIVLTYLSVQDRGNAAIELEMERAFYFSFVPSFVAYYLFYFYVFPKISEKKVLISIVLAIVIVIASSIIGNILIYLFLGIDSLTQAQESVFVGLIFVAFVCLIIGTAGLVTRGFISWYNELKVKEELKERNHNMELALVKAQLDPHFLFNTLNNIDVLILKNAEEASNYLNKLSDIMRFMLFETKSDKIPLAKEIEYIEKYIALQKIRSSNSNYINLTINGLPEDRSIAPMVFLPFIENAFKHSTNKKLDNAITVELHLNKEDIQFNCYNKYNPKRKLKSINSGLGNDLILKRLHLIYPDNHNLTITRSDDTYGVSLTIKQ